MASGDVGKGNRQYGIARIVRSNRVGKAPKISMETVASLYNVSLATVYRDITEIRIREEAREEA